MSVQGFQAGSPKIRTSKPIQVVANNVNLDQTTYQVYELNKLSGKWVTSFVSLECAPLCKWTFNTFKIYTIKYLPPIDDVTDELVDVIDNLPNEEDILTEEEEATGQQGNKRKYITPEEEDVIYLPPNPHFIRKMMSSTNSKSLQHYYSSPPSSYHS